MSTTRRRHENDCKSSHTLHKNTKNQNAKNKMALVLRQNYCENFRESLTKW